MDLIGKIYKDYILKESILDGKSHLLNNYSYGGIINLFNDENFLKLLEKDFLKSITLICNKSTKNKLNIDFKKIILQEIFVNDSLPEAFIFEQDGKRTSYVINDKVIQLNQIKKFSSSACLYYGDKINSNFLKEYEKVFIDTAGNSTSDLEILSINNKYPNNSVISISKEYLNKNLINKFLQNNLIIISHCPEYSEIYEKKEMVRIPNKYYLQIKNYNKKINITGLGDKFILLVAMNNQHLKLSLSESVIASQKMISEYLLIDN